MQTVKIGTRGSRLALAALPEMERKSLYVLRKSDPAAFCARAEALLADGKNP